MMIEEARGPPRPPDPAHGRDLRNGLPGDRSRARRRVEPRQPGTEAAETGDEHEIRRIVRAFVGSSEPSLCRHGARGYRGEAETAHAGQPRLVRSLHAVDRDRRRGTSGSIHSPRHGTSDHVMQDRIRCYSSPKLRWTEAILVFEIGSVEHDQSIRDGLDVHVRIRLGRGRRFDVGRLWDLIRRGHGRAGLAGHVGGAALRGGRRRTGHDR